MVASKPRFRQRVRQKRREGGKYPNTNGPRAPLSRLVSRRALNYEKLIGQTRKQCCAVYHFRSRAEMGGKISEASRRASRELSRVPQQKRSAYLASVVSGVRRLWCRF